MKNHVIYPRLIFYGLIISSYDAIHNVASIFNALIFFSGY